MSFGFWTGFWIVSVIAAFLGGKRYGTSAVAALEAERDVLLEKIRKAL